MRRSPPREILWKRSDAAFEQYLARAQLANKAERNHKKNPTPLNKARRKAAHARFLAASDEYERMVEIDREEQRKRGLLPHLDLPECADLV